MFEDTRVPAVPEDSSGPEPGDPEPPTETVNSNLSGETSPAAGELDGGAPTPDLLQSAGENSNAENEIAPPTEVSARKIAANRENATHSTGPRTDEGKAASAKNAIKHGVFAGKLFNQTAAGASERLEYEEIGSQLVEHYNPVGFKEQLLVAQIFAELVRQGRILHFEEEVLTRKETFFTTSGLDKVVKYSACHSRELARLFQELEREQFERKSQILAGDAPKAEQRQSRRSTAVTPEGAPEAK